VWDSPEDCELNFEVRAGETVYVRAAPRAQNPSADAREGRSTGLHGAAATPAAADGTVTIVGTALARPDRKCGGAYSLRVVDAGVALPELPNVRAAL
jgi:hypothetical protein